MILTNKALTEKWESQTQKHTIVFFLNSFIKQKDSICSGQMFCYICNRPIKTLRNRENARDTSRSVKYKIAAEAIMSILTA